jgi:hypothetical protein
MTMMRLFLDTEVRRILAVVMHQLTRGQGSILITGEDLDGMDPTRLDVVVDIQRDEMLLRLKAEDEDE